MSLGSRIQFFRWRQGFTQKKLGIALGFTESTADVRVSQYESDSKVPRYELLCQMADVLQVSVDALKSPNLDSTEGIMQTLFLMEDLCAFSIDEHDGTLCIRLDTNSPKYEKMQELFSEWYKEATKFREGSVTREQYDQWRYLYPHFEQKGGHS